MLNLRTTSRLPENLVLRRGVWPRYSDYNNQLVWVPPLPPPVFEIINLQAKTSKIFEFKGLIVKIFRNKDLRDPFASLRISAAGSRFAHAR
jgi:hypothetical protein